MQLNLFNLLLVMNITVSTCNKLRSNVRSERSLYVPFVKQIQISTSDGESMQNEEESFFMRGLFTPIGNSSHFDCKLESLAEPDRLQAQFDQNDSLPGEDCFFLLWFFGFRVRCYHLKNFL